MCYTYVHIYPIFWQVIETEFYNITFQKAVSVSMHALYI